jgi:hypothetical protein
MLEIGLESSDEVWKYWSGLLSKGRCDRQHALIEAAAFRAVSAVGDFPLDHGRASGAFAGVVGRFDALDADEGPKCALDLEKLLAGAGSLGMRACRTLSEDVSNALP